ncbi:MAG: molybdopterin molybdotransferase MoeA [Cyclobacteriaceae bacterium]
MISSNEAQDIVMSNTVDWGVEEVEVSDCVGRVLREGVVADRDFPPYNRVTMDGIAIKHSDFESGIREYKITHLQTAGARQHGLKGTGNAHEIMTGAVLSDGADIIVRYEDLTIEYNGEERLAKVNNEGIPQWKNVHKKGSDKRKGDLLISSGKKLMSSDVAVLATVGCEKVKVSRLPKVAIISTGDELVEVGKEPQNHQIRMSNSIMIQAKLNDLGVANERFHLMDDFDLLKEKIERIIEEFDVILMSGGVSKGKADYVPEVLDQLGVQKLFHKVAQRPGKPFWFGKFGEEKCVFALPGNPVSTFMCFVVYFLPWLHKSLRCIENSDHFAILNENVSFKPALTYFMQVHCKSDVDGKNLAEVKQGGGSGDLSNLVQSNGFLEMPPKKGSFEKEEAFRIYLY